jgi:hypothetical protein
VRYLIAFVRFWYDFIVGDDAWIAVGVAATLAVTALLAHHGTSAWWVMIASVIAVLLASVRRGAR